MHSTPNPRRLSPSPPTFWLPPPRHCSRRSKPKPPSPSLLRPLQIQPPLLMKIRLRRVNPSPSTTSTATPSVTEFILSLQAGPPHAPHENHPPRSPASSLVGSDSSIAPVSS